MIKENPVDYQTALEQCRKEEHMPDNPIHTPKELTAVPMIDGYVDYLAAIKAWDKEQAGIYKIRLHNKKRNSSHDPERT